MATPMVLINVFERATFFAFLFIPIEANNAVNVVPIFAPKTIGIESIGSINPCCTKIIAKPVTTVLDCRMIVKNTPIKMLTRLFVV